MAALLDGAVRQDLRGLQKETADVVARHLVAAGRLVDEEPERALAHARFARRRASRIAVVREAAGIAAYHAGEWAEALAELRAARRMGGGPGHLAVMADIERALGRPERALDLARAPEVRELGVAESVELAIVAAGARRDLGETDAAVVGLQSRHLDPALREPWSARLFYAYADNLLAAGRESEALTWFVHAAEADADGDTDAAARIAELSGEAADGDDDLITFGVEDLEEDAGRGDAPAEDTAPAEGAASREETGAEMPEATTPGRVGDAAEEGDTRATEASYRDGAAPAAAIVEDAGADGAAGATPDDTPVGGGADLDAELARVGAGGTAPVGDTGTAPVGDSGTGLGADGTGLGSGETAPVVAGDTGPGAGGVGDGGPGPGDGGTVVGGADGTRAGGASAGRGAEHATGGGTDGHGGSAPHAQDGGGEPGVR